MCEGNGVATWTQPLFTSGHADAARPRNGECGRPSQVANQYYLAPAIALTRGPLPTIRDPARQHFASSFPIPPTSYVTAARLSP